ncbi:IS66 family transposase [Rhodovulum tesquicola]|uniref:IS66 family transposase n=1 Tax=Rhodovulum strictum TaxID=58314 RepID=A0A844B7G2_9RHOB|nr:MULTISPECIES: IS66 family transposase [Rhodovulum]MCO8145853.1 IS66 family transposase [Rhodovulum tesquicola]MRH22191.1 IS66 family transposase [Rhodovulum strictum]
MSSALDPDLLARLPPDLRAAVEAQMRKALTAEAELRQHLEAENADLRALNERLEHLVRELQRARFGPRSEKLHPDQMELAFEDIEVAIAAATEEHDTAAEARTGTRPPRKARGPRSLPKDLPREERIIAPEDLNCPCGCGQMVQIGEDRSERLDLTPAQFRVLVTIRPRYACPRGRSGVVQAKAPPALIEGGLPTEALLAHVAVSKFSEHLPLYRQSQVMARHGIEIDRSTLADWMGKVAFHLRPIVDRIAEHMKGSGKLFADETPLPVLNPGAGKTKTGFLWVMARDDRPWGGTAPPAVVFTYAPGRGGAHAEDMLKGFEGILQVDGYKGYDRLADGRRAEGAPLTLAFCWAHVRRKLIDARPKAGSPLVDEALKRIAALYAIEKDIRGQPPEERRAVRQARAVPLLENLHEWLKQQAARISTKSDLGRALAYALEHWDGLVLFTRDGRVEMDSNPVENRIRPVTLGRKNALFAGHDEGGRSWARFASVIETCKLNGVEPYAWLKATLEAIAAGHPNSDIDALLPWHFGKAAIKAAA